jgi:hypothetical protein
MLPARLTAFVRLFSSKRSSEKYDTYELNRTLASVNHFTCTGREQALLRLLLITAVGCKLTYESTLPCIYLRTRFALPSDCSAAGSCSTKPLRFRDVLATVTVAARMRRSSLASTTLLRSHACRFPNNVGTHA